MNDHDQDREMRLANFEKQMRLCSKISAFLIDQIRMTDQELLALAAKASGIKILRFGESEDYYEPCRGYVAFIERHWPGDDPMDIPMEAEWNPLDDDGDAFRLAVQLRLMVAWDRWEDNDYACIRHRDLDEEIGIQINQRPEQTVRRAIVLAAAAIGRTMK